MTEDGQFHYMARAASTINNRISAQKQARHVEGTKQHADFRAQSNKQGKSHQCVLRITQDEAQTLVYEHAGKGETTYDKNGKWRKLEHCEADHIVGVYHDMYNEPHETMRSMIMCAKTSAHIVPVKEKSK